MTTDVRMTVDVEDWYDGMAVLGESIPRPEGARSGLSGLADRLAAAGKDSVATLFVVGDYLPAVSAELSSLAESGHEIASHGADHGRLPGDPGTLIEWLRRSRCELEQAVQRPVAGFRSPRFDVPGPIGLLRYRELLAEAGFAYVSDTSLLGPASPVAELPVLSWRGVPIGGGSYQRLLPRGVVNSVVAAADGPAVLYYHSYDFGATLPPTGAIRSLAQAKQLVGRGRVAAVFTQLLSRFGSKACGHVEW